MDIDVKREFRGPPPMEMRGEVRGPPGPEMMDPREFRGGPPPPMDRDEMRMREMRGPPPDKGWFFLDFTAFGIDIFIHLQLSKCHTICFYLKYISSMVI